MKNIANCQLFDSPETFLVMIHQIVLLVVVDDTQKGKGGEPQHNNMTREQTDSIVTVQKPHVIAQLETPFTTNRMKASNNNQKRVKIHKLEMTFLSIKHAIALLPASQLASLGPTSRLNFILKPEQSYFNNQ